MTLVYNQEVRWCINYVIKLLVVIWSKYYKNVEVLLNKILIINNEFYE